MWEPLGELIPSSVKKAGIQKSVSDAMVCEEFQSVAKNILGDDWQEKILTTRYGFELWKYLFIVVLILFFLEMIIVKIIEKVWYYFLTEKN